MTCKTTRRLFSLSAAVALCALLTAAWSAPAGATPITIDTVPVGNAGNAPDTLSTTNNPDNLLFGAVDYNYRIGTTEVTVGQYTAFLNAVAKTDTYGLYRTDMATDLNIAGIARANSPGNYEYSVIGSPSKPVTYVSWGDAARFANWLHNGQPIGLQNASTTEDGAYTLNGATSDAALNAVVRNVGVATWWIPSEDEWYKAAYHKNDGATGNYWDYPTSTNDTPYSDQPPGSDAPTQSNTANLYINVPANIGFNDGFAVSASASFDDNQNYLTDVGAYVDSVSPYGTYDQGGNVYEWNEALISGSLRGLRGGSWANGALGLAASNRADNIPTVEGINFGFRVATVPEPSTAVLGMIGCVLLLWWRRKH